VEPEPASKFARAAGLVEDLASGDAGVPEPAVEAPAPTEPGRLGLSAGKTPGVQGADPLAEAGRKILRFHLARMLAREAGTRAGKDPEELHAMRVATRRMRAAWRVFGDAYRPRRVRRYVDELRSLAAALGRVRDLDVLIDGLDAYSAHLPPAEAVSIAPLAASWRGERTQARRVLAQIFESDAYRRFTEDYVEFVRTDGAGIARVTATEPQRVRDSAGSRIWSAYEYVRAYDGVLRWADIATIHQLRIAGKRLRYTLEFFREPLGPEASMLIERVTALQDHLGLLHDADVAATLARTFLVERSAHLAPATVDAVGGYLRNRELEVTHLRRTMGPAWRRMVSIEFRRGLSRAISAL
jgi:CHAD domain-containing protein